MRKIIARRKIHLKLPIIASQCQFRAIEMKKKQIMGHSPVVDALHVKIVYNHVGKPTGDAEVLFANKADARKAMTTQKQNLLHRYIEMFDVGPVGSPSKSMTENFNTYPKGNREEKDTFEAANNSRENGWFTCVMIISVQ